MFGYLNIQIIPCPQKTLRWAKVVQRPAEEGKLVECLNCHGTGKLPRRGDACKKCSGNGKGMFELAMRAEPKSEFQCQELENLLSSLPKETRIQKTVRLEEFGGGATNTGRAVVIAGLNGEKLTSIYGRSTCQGPHAVFYVHAAFVISYYQHRGQGDGLVQLIGVDRTKKLGVERVDLWRFVDGGEIEVLNPERAKAFNFPTEAVEAARKKARTYHCRSSFYSVGRAANGPSGALRGAGAANGGLPSPLKGPGIGY